jgi:hypothetical protein
LRPISRSTSRRPSAESVVGVVSSVGDWRLTLFRGGRGMGASCVRRLEGRWISRDEDGGPDLAYVDDISWQNGEFLAVDWDLAE